MLAHILNEQIFPMFCKCCLCSIWVKRGNRRSYHLVFAIRCYYITTHTHTHTHTRTHTNERERKYHIYTQMVIQGDQNCWCWIGSILSSVRRTNLQTIPWRWWPSNWQIAGLLLSRSRFSWYAKVMNSEWRFCRWYGSGTQRRACEHTFSTLLTYTCFPKHQKSLSPHHHIQSPS